MTEQNTLDVIKTALYRYAEKAYAEKPLMLAFAKAAVAEYIEARKAYMSLISGTVSSYSLQGRSINKRDANSIPVDALYDKLLEYFPASELPESLGGSMTRQIDFSEGLQ